MRNHLLASCAIAAIALGGGLAKAQSPQAQSPSTTNSPAQTTEHGRGADSAQRQGGSTASPGRTATEERSSGNMTRRDATERRADERSEPQDRSERSARAEGRAEQRFDRQEHANDERGRRGEERSERRTDRQDRFNDERARREGARAEQRSERRERFTDERSRRGDEGFREERRYRTDRDYDRDRERRIQDRRYGERFEERGFQDRRYGARAERYEGGSRLHISTRQRARLHDVLIRRRVEPASVDFPVRVGARIPNYITSYPLPEEVHEYLPDYEGYRYFVTNDEVVLVDPDTLEVVAVLED